MVMRAAAATIALAGLRGVLRLTEQAVESVLAYTAEVVEQAQMTPHRPAAKERGNRVHPPLGVDRIQVVEVEALQGSYDFGRARVQDPEHLP